MGLFPPPFRFTTADRLLDRQVLLSLSPWLQYSTVQACRPLTDYMGGGMKRVSTVGPESELQHLLAAVQT